MDFKIISLIIDYTKKYPKENSIVVRGLYSKSNQGKGAAAKYVIFSSNIYLI